MRPIKQYYVYIMANESRMLYTGVTNDLVRRVCEHRNKLVPGFASSYNIIRLVYFEETSDVQAAIAREKQIKGWLRQKKVELIESVNPRWQDLSDQWYETKDPSLRSELVKKLPLGLAKLRQWVDNRQNCLGGSDA